LEHSLHIYTMQHNIILKDGYIMQKFIIFSLMVFSSLTFAQTEPSDEVPQDIIYTDSTTDSTVRSQASSTTTLKSPPASAITPTINTSNSDLCTFGVAGAVQTQILGISTGTQVTDDNCERLKNAKTLYDMGMKVAAVSVMCTDRRVFDAMMNAGTPCPYDGMIGKEAKTAWEIAEANGEDVVEEDWSDGTKTMAGAGAVITLLLGLLL